MTTTDCMARIRFGFHPRRAVDTIDAPTTSSDGGLVLLRQVDEQLELCARLAPMLVDRRNPRLIRGELFTIGEIDKVWILGNVYEIDLPRVPTRAPDHPDDTLGTGGSIQGSYRLGQR